MGGVDAGSGRERGVTGPERLTGEGRGMDTGLESVMGGRGVTGPERVTGGEGEGWIQGRRGGEE